MDADVLFFFREHPKALPLYERLEELIFAQVPDVWVKVGKSQISFANKHNFAFASFLPVRKAKDRPDPYLVVSFGLDHRLDSPRIDVAVEPYPNRWTHHVLIGSAEELDDELLSWIREAGRFSAAKR